MNRKASIVVAVLLAPVLLLVAGVLLARGGGAATSSVAPVAPGVEALDAGADPASAVDALQRRLERLPQDETAWAALGFAYVAQARRTADPSWYDKADEALARSLGVQPEGNADALAGQAALANARHDFSTGRDLALAAVEADAYDSTARGVLADAQIELGDLEGALSTLDAMLGLRPGVPSFTRTAYSYELRGDVDSARYSLERALEVSAGAGDAAYVLLQLGDLAWSQGDFAQADQHYAEGLRRDPDQVALLASQARSAASQGRVEEAVAIYADVVERLPQPSYLVEYGELLDSLDRPDEAAAQYAVADASAALFAASGSVPDVELVLYQADHGRPAQALAAAHAQYETRRSPHVLDAMAWALHVNGRHAEALVLAEQVEAAGTKNATWAYHRGMIQLAQGDTASARTSLQSALDTNPGFSMLHAPLARAALDAMAAG
jgi:tetratricopeptide (TPR) repeat protein